MNEEKRDGTHQNKHKWTIQGAKFWNEIFFLRAKERKRNRKTDIQTGLTLHEKEREKEKERKEKREALLC